MKTTKELQDELLVLQTKHEELAVKKGKSTMIVELISLYTEDPDFFKKEMKNILDEGVFQKDDFIAELPDEILSSERKIIDNFLSGKGISEEEATDVAIAFNRIDYKISELDDEISAKRQELLENLNENPLEKIAYGDAGQIRRLFESDTKKVIQQLTNIVIEAFEGRKPSRLSSRKGEVNFPKTIKRSMSYEGDPYELVFRSREQKANKAKPHIYLIHDISGSCSPYVPLSVVLAHGFHEALKDYEITMYTMTTEGRPPSQRYIKDIIKQYDKAERKDLETSINYGYGRCIVDRINKKSFHNIKSLESIQERLERHVRGDSDYMFVTLYPLIMVAPENSVFLLLTDHEPESIAAFNLMIAKEHGFKQKLKQFQNNVFWISLREAYGPTAVKKYSEFRYMEGDTSFGLIHGSYSSSKMLVPGVKGKPEQVFPSRDDIKDIVHKRKTPLRVERSYGEDTISYAEWLDELVRRLKTRLV